jgi:hypothetical protein
VSNEHDPRGPHRTDESDRMSEVQPFKLRIEETSGPEQEQEQQTSHASRLGKRPRNNASSPSPVAPNGSNPVSHAERALGNDPKVRREIALGGQRVDQTVLEVDRELRETHGYRGLSDQSRIRFRDFIKGLPITEQRQVLESMNAQLDNEEEVEERTTTTVYPGMIGGAAPLAPAPVTTAPPSPVQPNVAPLATPPVSGSNVPAPAQPPAKKPKQMPLPGQVDYPPHHHCHIYAWLATSLLAEEASLFTKAGTDVVSSILGELNNAYGSNGNWKLFGDMFKVVSGYLNTLTTGVSAVLHTKLDKVAEHCLAEGHIDKETYKYIHDQLVKPAVAKYEGTKNYKGASDDEVKKMAERGRSSRRREEDDQLTAMDDSVKDMWGTSMVGDLHLHQ